MNNKKGKLNLILGCMWSGKTSELLTRYQRYTLGKKKCILVKHSIDIRYDPNKIVSHNGVSINAIVCSHLYEINKIVIEYDVVCIDEIQFYEDAYIFCDMWANMGIIVEVCGLNGTSDRHAFPIISKLLPYVDNITYLKAIDEKTGKNAVFTNKICDEPSKNGVLVGGNDKYIANDRYTYISNMTNIKNDINNKINDLKNILKNIKKSDDIDKHLKDIMINYFKLINSENSSENLEKILT